MEKISFEFYKTVTSDELIQTSIQNIVRKVEIDSKVELKLLIQDKILFKQASLNNMLESEDTYYNSSLNKLEQIKYLLGKDPIKVLDKILPYISSKEIKKKISIDTTSLNKGFISSTFNIKEFNRITSLTLEDYGITYDDINIVKMNEDFNMELKISNYNCFNTDVMLEGKFSNNAFGHIIDENHKIVILNAIGLQKDTAIPNWIEYLVDGCLNAKYNNANMAFLNIYTAMENFIDTIDDIIFEFYINEYSNFPLYKIEYEVDSIIDKLDNEIWCKLDNETFDEINAEIEKNKKKIKEIERKIDKSPSSKNADRLIKEAEKLDRIIKNKTQKIDAMARSLKKQFKKVVKNKLIIGFNKTIKNIRKKNIRLFACERQCLNEKLTNIIEVLEMDTSNENFKKFHEILKKWSSYTEIRNKIAHGGSIETEKIDDIGEIIFVIVSLILSISLNEDVVENEWDKVF